MITQKKIAEAYQPLFDLMSNEHDLILHISDMDEIISAVEEVQENLTELYRDVCDVEGCNETPSCGGSYWKDKGYWSTCSKHSDYARAGNPMPEMKEEAIQREKSRGSDGRLPFPEPTTNQSE